MSELMSLWSVFAFEVFHEHWMDCFIKQISTIK